MLFAPSNNLWDMVVWLNRFGHHIFSLPLPQATVLISFLSVHVMILTMWPFWAIFTVRNLPLPFLVQGLLFLDCSKCVISCQGKGNSSDAVSPLPEAVCRCYTLQRSINNIFSVLSDDILLSFRKFHNSFIKGPIFNGGKLTKMSICLSITLFDTRSSEDGESSGNLTAPIQASKLDEVIHPIQVSIIFNGPGQMCRALSYWSTISLQLASCGTFSMADSLNLPNQR